MERKDSRVAVEGLRRTMLVAVIETVAEESFDRVEGSPRIMVVKVGFWKVETDSSVGVAEVEDAALIS